MNIVEYNIHELKPASYNPRTLSEKQFVELKESMEKFGTMEPAIINVHPGREGIIISGHQRLKIAESLGLDVYPCVEVDLPENEEKELNIRMNKNTGSWDFDVLANQFDMGDLMEWGFEEEELIGRGEDGGEGGGEAPGAGALPKQPKPELGRIYQLGRHILMCGDATDESDVKRLMGSDKADMVFTDPPYGIGLDKEGQTLGKSKQYGAVLNDDSTAVAKKAIDIIFGLDIPLIFIWGGNYFADILPPVPSWIIWDKQGGKHVTYADCEMAWTNSGKPARIFLHIWDGFRRDSEKGEERTHPTQKPVALFVECMREMSKEAIIVLDLFGGSGSTIIACEQTGRHCRMMELDPQYVQVIIERWEKMTDETAIDIESGKKWDEVDA